MKPRELTMLQFYRPLRKQLLEVFPSGPSLRHGSLGWSSILVGIAGCKLGDGKSSRERGGHLGGWALWRAGDFSGFVKGKLTTDGLARSAKRAKSGLLSHWRNMVLCSRVGAACPFPVNTEHSWNTPQRRFCESDSHVNKASIQI